MHALIIFDRRNQRTPKLGTTPIPIVAICIFSHGQKLRNIYIDYISVSNKFVRGGIATMLMNTAQHCCKCWFDDNQVDESEFTTYVNCIISLNCVYERYGFEVCNLDELSSQHNDNHCVYQHFDAKEWHKHGVPNETQSMNILSRRKFVYRWTNIIEYPFSEVEESLYSNNSKTADGKENISSKENISTDPESMNPAKRVVTQNLTSTTITEDEDHSDLFETEEVGETCVNSSLVTAFELSLDALSDQTKYTCVTEKDVCTYQEAEALPAFVSKYMRTGSSFFNFGKFYVKVLDDYHKGSTENLRSRIKLRSTSCAIEQLSVRLIPVGVSLAHVNVTKEGMWVQLRCEKCKQTCYLKKKPGVPLSDFLMKAIYSRWMTHVYGLETFQRDIWYEKNMNWNHCRSRVKSYFQDLKEASIFDSFKDISDKDREHDYFQHYLHLRELSELIFKHHCRVVDGLIAMGIDIRISLRKNRACRTVKYKDRKRLLIQDIVPGTTTLVRAPKQQKMQNKDDITRRREAEKQWSKEYYFDLSIQKKFIHICYVKPDMIPFNRLHRDSKKYVNYYRSEKYKKQKKKDPDVKRDLSHFIALTKRDNRGHQQDHVISDDYFVAKNSMGREIYRRISIPTVAKAYDSPNALIRLSKTDIRLINSHVQKILSYGDIQKIKLLPKSEYQMESIVFESKRHESRIRYKGMDSSKREYLLSDDWLEINFGKFEVFFDQIMVSTNVGNYIDVPATGRKSSFTNYPLKKTDMGPKLEYIQHDNKSCLFSSMASALHFLNKPLISNKIMSVYDTLNEDGTYVPSYKDILKVTRNAYKIKGEKNIKMSMTKCNYREVSLLLKDNSFDVILAVLSNRHAVTLCKDYIFDPAFTNALPRTERSLRVSAELLEVETMNHSLKMLYGFHTH